MEFGSLQSSYHCERAVTTVETTAAAVLKCKITGILVIFL